MSYSLTKKSNNLIKTEFFDGVEYALCEKSNDTELWIAIKNPEPDICSGCGYNGFSLDKHHVHGRKNSDETIVLCPNCHRKLHSGA